MTKSVWLASIIVITAVSAMTWAYEAFQGPTELIQYDPDKAFEGYTMFGAQSGENVYLIDMQGQVVHMWPVPEDWRPSVSATHARLLEDGTLERGSGNVFQIVD